jgi:hypothetical protein
MRKIPRHRRSAAPRTAGLLCLFVLASAGILSAQPQPGTPPASTNTPAVAPSGTATPQTAPPPASSSQADPKYPYVCAVEKVEASQDQVPPTVEPNPPPCIISKEEPKVRLRNTIAVRVSNLAGLIAKQEADPSKKIILFLNDRPLRDLADDPPTDHSQNVLRFPLRRTEDSREAWASILGKPPFWGTRRVKVSVGIEHAIPSNTYVQLQVLPHGWFAFWLFLFAILVFVFWRLAKRSNLLRDDVPTIEIGARPPFSLARCQAAWWFFVVLASYLFIGLVTGDYNTSITGTVLVLLGIAAGTTFASAIVDKSRDTPAERQKQEDAAAALAAQPAQSQADTAEAAWKANPEDVQKALTFAKMNETAKVEKSQLSKLRNKSEDFFTDILSDANGVNLHRFQMMAWTVVLSIVFVAQVYRDLGMPEFSETLLSLMGISAGTFLGLKTTEPTVPTKPESSPKQPKAPSAQPEEQE